MDIRDKRRTLRDQFDESRFNFISRELDLAITFSQVAATSEEHARSERNARNAQKAYSAANHFLEETPLNQAQRQEIQDKVTVLQNLLEKVSKRSRRIERNAPPTSRTSR